MHQLRRFLPALAICLLATVVIAQKPIKVAVADYERASSAVFFFTQSAESLEVFGQVELTYGQPVWKAEHGRALEDSLPEARMRLGNNFFSTFDTSCVMQAGDVSLQPGLYYLALEREEEGELSLLFLDPVSIRAKKQNASQSSETTGGIALPLNWSTSEVEAKQLEIDFTPVGTGGKDVELSLRFGFYKMTAILTAQVEPETVQCSAAKYERASAGTFFYSQTESDFKVFGQYELTYGSPVWKKEYGSAVKIVLPETRLRLGNNFFASFDSSCPVLVGDETLAPGYYYLAMERGGEGEMFLVFLDPEPIRERKQNGNHSNGTTGGLRMKLDWTEASEIAERLKISFEPAGGENPAAWMSLRFGNLEMNGLLGPVLK